MSKNSQYWYCIVPKCKNTSVSAPDKQFISVPKDAIVRKKWCDAMNRCDKQNVILSCKSARYYCGDHFDIPNDMDNFIKHKIMGLGNRQLKPKKGILPHIFDCQSPPSIIKVPRAKDIVLDVVRDVFKSDSGKDENAPGSNVKYLNVQLPIEYCRGAVDSHATSSFTIKMEPGSLERGGHEIPYTEIEINRLDIKEEYVEYSDRNDPTAGLMDENKIYSMNWLSSTHKDDEGNVKISKPFPCPECSYSCFLKSVLKRHMLTHCREKPFSCSDCTYSCSRNSDMTTHKLRHSAEKQFSCYECDYSCSHKSSLKYHMLKHRGEKPFSCTKCNFSSTRKSALKTHLLTHLREKPFSCSECAYSCIQKSQMKTHMLIHLGEKPFSCCECSYSSIRKFDLVAHIWTHCKEKPFSCSECSYSCSQNSYLKVHMRTHYH